MIDKLLDRIAQAGTLRSIYQALASLCFFVTLAAWCSEIRSWMEKSPVHDRELATLGHTPLAIAYRASSFLGVDHSWVNAAANYLHADPHRTAAFGMMACIWGLTMLPCLSPDTSGPSLQACTWWICAMVAMQCSPRYMIFMLLLLGGWLGLQKKRISGLASHDILNLMVAALAVIFPLARLLEDGHTHG